MKTWMTVAIGMALVLSNGAVAKASTHHSSSSSHHSGGRHSSGDSHHSGGSHYSSSRYHSSGGHHLSSGHHSNRTYYGSKLSRKAAGVPRDAKGRIERSSQAKSAFKSQHACPSTGKRSGACSGYVIDHVTPLKRGGADSSSNMQWQTKEAAKAKDKVE